MFAIGKQHLVPVLHRKIHSANFNRLFADTKYLFDVNNNELAIVTFRNLNLVNSRTLEIRCVTPCQKVFVLCFLHHE